MEIYPWLRKQYWVFLPILIIVVAFMSFSGIFRYRIGQNVEFSLRALDGSVVNISDYKGRVVFIDFFFPEEIPCPNAQRAYEDGVSLIKTFEDYPVTFISISLSPDIEQIKNYCSGKKKNSLVLIDFEQKVYQKFFKKGVMFSTYTFPAYVILDKEGKLSFVSGRKSSDEQKGKYPALLIRKLLI